MPARFTRFNAACDLNCARVQQQLFSERCFAGIWVRDDGKAATSKYFCGWSAGGIGIDGNSALMNIYFECNYKRVSLLRIALQALQNAIVPGEGGLKRSDLSSPVLIL